MRKLFASVAVLLMLALVGQASAATLKGGPGAQRITGTKQYDRVFAGKGPDLIFARDKVKDYVNCGPGFDVAVLDRKDNTRHCEVRRYPPLPRKTAPLPVSLIPKDPVPTTLISIGAPGTVTPLPKATPSPTDDGKCKSPTNPKCQPPPPPPPPPPDPEPTPDPTPGPSGEPMPVGPVAGWGAQIVAEDFTTDVSSWGDCTSWSAGATCPSLPDAYRSKWWAYPTSYQDTREKTNGDGGFYTPANMSMTGGLLRIPLRRVNGTSQSNAPIPKATISRTYGRYSVRAMSTTSDTFKVAWLLWREVASWGEIDFPEADLDGTISAFNHHQGGGQAAIDTSVPFAGPWHTYTTEWKPGNVSFFIDGVKIGEDTVSVPSSAMTWVLQSETQLGGSIPANSAEANIYVDWVAAWSFDNGGSPPAPAAPQNFGLVANSDHGNAIAGAAALGARLMRMEFSAFDSPSTIVAGVDAARSRGIEPIVQVDIDGNWMGSADRMGDLARALIGHAKLVEFGNESSFSYKGTQNQGTAYGQAAARAIDLMAGTGVGLLVQGDDANTGSGWPSLVRAALGSRVPAGWVMHPYGPGWETRIARNAGMLPPDAPIFVTEWGVASDDGRCLNDNYGFPTCLTYTQAGDLIRSNVSAMFARFPQIKAVLLFQVKDQRASGSGEREHYFGALKSDLTEKPGLTDDVRSLL